MATVPTTPRVALDLRRVSPFVWACIAALVLMFWIAYGSTTSAYAQRMERSCEVEARTPAKYVDHGLGARGRVFDISPRVRFLRQQGVCVVNTSLTTWGDGTGFARQRSFEFRIAPQRDGGWRFVSTTIPVDR